MATQTSASSFEAPIQQSTSTLPVINIGTRRSLLALKQTDIVEAALSKAWPDRSYKIHAMATMGDKNQVTPLHEMGAKALWTHELEAGLLEGRLDLVVHSLKGSFARRLPSMVYSGAMVLCFQGGRRRGAGERG